MAERTPVDEFRRALAGASRAIARDPEVEVVFASEPAPASGKTARVPSPGPSLQRKLVAEARGAADSVALRLRHHDERLHSHGAPLDPEARAVFDALETARVEALGARSMDGVRANLNDLADARVRLDAITRARTAEEVPLATAVGYGAPPVARAPLERGDLTQRPHAQSREPEEEERQEPFQRDHGAGEGGRRRSSWTAPSRPEWCAMRGCLRRTR